MKLSYKQTNRLSHKQKMSHNLHIQDDLNYKSSNCRLPYWTICKNSHIVKNTKINRNAYLLHVYTFRLTASNMALIINEGWLTRSYILGWVKPMTRFVKDKIVPHPRPYPLRCSFSPPLLSPSFSPISFVFFNSQSE